MVTKKTSAQCGNVLCNNPDCSCDPCSCTIEKCCSKMNDCCSSGHCHGRKGPWVGSLVRILIAVVLIVGAYIWGVMAGLDVGNNYGYGRGVWDDEGRGGYRDDIRMKRGCNKDGMMVNQTTPVTTPMGMSMMDMSRALEGKTGDDLNKSFLVGMIPHHEGAVEMAKYLASSNKPELVKLGGEIIVAQTREIEQMKKWMIEWGYTSTGTTSTGTLSPEQEMMLDHCRQMPEMMGCEKYQ